MAFAFQVKVGPEPEKTSLDGECGSESNSSQLYETREAAASQSEYSSPVLISFVLIVWPDLWSQQRVCIFFSGLFSSSSLCLFHFP